jgi:hypothetical protein
VLDLCCERPPPVRTAMTPALRVHAHFAVTQTFPSAGYSGGFAINAALGGAVSVTAVDSSASALRLAAANGALPSPRSTIPGRLRRMHPCMMVVATLLDPIPWLQLASHL